MTDIQKWYDLRSQIVEVLRADLMGGPGDDTIDEPPLDRFVVGILHPQDGVSMDEVDTEVDDAQASAGSDSVFDPAVALSRMRYPSSVGMTFAVDVVRSPEFVVHAGAARFAPTEGDTTSWTREQVAPLGQRVRSTDVGSHTVPLADGLELYVVVRPAVDHVAALTVVLLNAHKLSAKGRRDEYCWFQPTLRVHLDAGAFVSRHRGSTSNLDDEDLDSYALLFRDVPDLGVGHGCAVTWDDESVAVDSLEATFLPWYDVKLAEPGGGGGVELPMSTLAGGDGADLLVALVADYRAWIRDRGGELDPLEPELATTARRHLAEAGEAADRMERGIHTLERDPDAQRAFAMMNAAMQLQRDRQDQQRGLPPQAQTWRPFQMAFILLNLEGLTDPRSPDRETADLLWFPTGGGKTEAYLGLIGYSVLLRRIRDPRDGGVSVIMRYTLRLLTIQQFERAAGLICALESLRREQLPDAVPISLGLWVGQGATPNSVKDAKDALKLLGQGDTSPKGNPVQLLHCPVCGSSLGIDDYTIRVSPDRMRVRCPDATCEYGKADGLPVYLLDEDVYRERPSLVIGTVDKFAMMAWRADVRNLFARDGAGSPPDLIVQDELHLISGPLGTMVGLYEAAVDAAASSSDGIRPKIIASTATIRRARQQVRAVFDREARQFPPSGLDSADSYFAVEASPTDKGTRRYLGVLSPSVSHTTLMVRCYAALLQAAKDLPADDEVRDAYWTILGYFNSLRVLGGAYMQVLDDIPDRLKVVATRSGTAAREIEEPGELTSRKDSSEIPLELDRLGRGLPDPQTRDVVLATNMISVGVDVDRLGLMVVMGQPQTTAEYIQATSRVGRRHPGLVVTVFNGARSRDLSHYETFQTYHRALYRQVEATGATPYAARARDRGLHGVLVSMIRMLVDDLASDARAVQLPTFIARARAVADQLVDRARSVAPDEADHVSAQLVALLDAWATRASAVNTLKYAGWFSPDGALLQDAGRAMQRDDALYPVDEPAWPTMTSLREVDATSSLYLVIPNKKGV